MSGRIRHRGITDMRVRRYVETAISVLNSNVFVLAAKQSQDRIYLGLFPPVVTAGNVFATTVPANVVANSIVLFTNGALGFQGLEFKSHEHPLTTCEWYVAQSGILGATVAVIVIEIFENEVTSLGGLQDVGMGDRILASNGRQKLDLSTSRDNFQNAVRQWRRVNVNYRDHNP